MGPKLTTIPLSHKEQAVYLYLEGNGINSFRVSELDWRGLGLGTDYLYVIIGRLERKGWVTGVGNGVYLRLPASAALSGGAYLEDVLEVGLKMHKGYLAFQSALRVHGLSEYQPFTVFVATKNKSKTAPLLEYYEARAVKLGKRFAGFERRSKYVVSTLSKTLFDCFCHPQHAGGYPHVLKALHTAEKINWKEMTKYADDFASSSLCQKIGYMISLLYTVTGTEPPLDFLEYLRSRVKNKTRLNFALKGGRYSKEWMIIDNMGERDLCSWWYNE